MRSRSDVVLFVLALALAVPGGGPLASVHEYVEDFATKEYCDDPQTTAEWDTLAGEIRLLPFELTLAGSYDTPGNATGVAVAGDYAYVADYTSGLQVIDISDPTSPVYAGSYNTPGYAYGVAVAGDHAYVADITHGLQVIDISDPTSPAYAGSYDTPGYAFGVAVAGDHAYVADGDSGLQVIDISDPTSPAYAGSYDTPCGAEAVEVVGDHAYVADGDSGLQVIDISDPTSPAYAGSYDTPGCATGVAVAGDHAYVADHASGLQVIDISDPTSPAYAGSYGTPYSACGVAVAGDRAYVMDQASGLQVIDISDPTSPAYAGSYDTPGSATGVAVVGDHAYVGDRLSGLQVIAVSDLVGDPLLAGSCDMSGSARGVAVAGDHAYVADYEYGHFHVVDIRDPGDPVLVGSCDTPGDAYCVAVAGDYAYVADDDDGLRVIDISDPANPVEVGGCDTPGNAYGVAVAGDHAYVADYGGGLRVVDISDPASPTIVGTCDAPGTYGVAVAGDYAYVAREQALLSAIDISDPANPVVVGSAGGLINGLGVAVAGDYAYVAVDAGGIDYYFVVVDISDPTAPSSVGHCTGGSFASGVAVAGDRAYVAVGSHGLRVIDISDPGNPVVAGSCDTDGFAWGVAVAGDQAYVADSGGGLQVIEVQQSVVNVNASIGRSLDLEPGGDEVIRARFTSTQTDSIRWELTADGGANWVGVVPGGGWHMFTSPGSNLQWLSDHSYIGGHVNPTCTDLSVSWLYRYGNTDAIADVLDDQGGWVRLLFTRSGHDFPDADAPIASYYVWSRVDEVLAARVRNEGAPLSRGQRSAALAQCEEARLAPPNMEGQDLRLYGGRVFTVSGRDRSDGFPAGTWEVVGSAPALQQDGYMVRVPTVGDSTVSGVEWTVLCVTAHTTTPSIWYASPPDSGYSVDNLAPAVPTGFAVNYTIVSGNELSWEPSGDGDFQHFRIYRDDSEEFEPSPENLVHMTIDVAWVDSEGTPLHHYKVTALDHAGNESDPALPESVTGVDEPAIPARFALHRSMPNPLRSGAEIAYDVPADGGEVRLTVYDVAGRRVRMLVDGPQTAGRKSATWDGRDDRGNAVGSGVYYCRLEAPGCEQSIKITVLR